MATPRSDAANDFTPDSRREDSNPRDDMNKTLALSMMLCGSMSLVFAGCAKDEGVDTSATSATTAGDGDGDNETSGNGDGDGDPGDGDPGDGDGDDMMTSLTGSPFVPMTDFGPIASECDPFLQDCPGTVDGTEKCAPYSSTGTNWDANKCVSVTGSGAPGDTCIYSNTTEATDDCGVDSHCWDVMDVDGMNVGVCTSFCEGTADDPICAPDTSCLIANDGSINLCVATCDPLLQNCNAGLACFWAANNFNCIFTTQDIPLGEACGYINDCAMGLGCLNADVLPDCNGSACCGSWCSVSEGAACAAPGTECTAFFEEGMAPPTYEDVGVCILPGA
jgi:hypothetical protein